MEQSVTPSLVEEQSGVVRTLEHHRLGAPMDSHAVTGAAPGTFRICADQRGSKSWTRAGPMEFTIEGLASLHQLTPASGDELRTFISKPNARPSA